MGKKTEGVGTGRHLPERKIERDGRERQKTGGARCKVHKSVKGGKEMEGQ